MKIDFISDVSCPWCVIGLRALEEVLGRLGHKGQVTLHFQPFELNPGMPPEGQDITEHLAQKYGATTEQTEQNRAAIRQRGLAAGFHFNMAARSRIYNTFDAHRLLHWAGLDGRQTALKHALFKAYFTDGYNPSDPEVLVRLAAETGLNPLLARQILTSNAYAEEVRELQRWYREQGIQAVPAVIINDQHLIQGGQPAEVFEQALRQIAAMPAQDPQ
jgi:predicted DsbA family dithiol-disulfide isomerase